MSMAESHHVNRRNFAAVTGQLPSHIMAHKAGRLPSQAFRSQEDLRCISRRH